ncbi:MAG TPA: hypothetical protein VKA79_05105 [Aestuariivirgaceae bacterium]|nr:hypothetical protein [Aestuariivirgaceae bacterium]
MPYRSQAEPLSEQPPYPDWSQESDRDFADHIAPFDRAYSPPRQPAGAPRTVRAIGETIIDRVHATSVAAAGCASAMMGSAATGARSMAQDLEGFARRQPLTALAGALLIGVVCGMFNRRRA